MWFVNILLLIVGCFLVIKIIEVFSVRFILLVYIIFNFVQQSLSIIYLNRGVFVSELNTFTYYVPESAPLFIFYTDVFLFFIYLFGLKYQYKFSQRKIEKVSDASKFFCYTSLVVTLGFLLYTFMDLLISGIPMFKTDMTHYNYYSGYSTLPFASTVNNLIGLFMYILGYSYVHIRKKSFKIICVLIVIFSILIRLLMGFRMSGLINIPLNFISVAVLISNKEFNSIRQILKPRYVFIAISIIIASLSFFVISSISNGSAKDINDVFIILENRAFGLGNHLWWALEADNYNGNDIYFHNLSNELNVLLTGKNQYDIDTGVYYLMRKYGYNYIVKVDIKTGIRYATPFITTAVFNFGYILSIPFIALISRIIVLFINNIDRAVKDDRVIQFILLCKIWGTFVTYVTASGTLAEWLNPENYIYLLIYLFLRYGFNSRFTLDNRERRLNLHE